MADLFKKAKSLYASTTNTFSTGDSETITPASVSGLPTDTEITLTFDRIDSSGTATPTKMERIIGTISGGNFVSRATTGRGADGTTEQAHTSPVVEYIYNAKDHNDQIDGFLVEHLQTGAHNNITASNISASSISINAVAVPTISSTSTFTNKRITKRVTTITSHATPTVNTDDCDVVDITAQAEAITSMTTNLSGTPTNKQLLLFEIKDNGTARAITWGASFVAGGVALPTTTVISKILTTLFQYSTANSLNKWRCIASTQEA